MQLSEGMGQLNPLDIVGAMVDGASGGVSPSSRTPVGMPGANPSVPRQPGAVTTVNPAIQAQISPQISPTMTQQQSSPGAMVSAEPMQFMPGGQTASMPGPQMTSPYGGMTAPGFPSTPGYTPVSTPGMFPGGFPGPGMQYEIPSSIFDREPLIQQPQPFFGMSPQAWLAVAALGVGAIIIMGQGTGKGRVFVKRKGKGKR